MTRHLLALATCLALSSAVRVLAEEPNLLVNASFEEGANEAGVPTGWQPYKAPSETRSRRLVETAQEGRQGLLIDDSDPTDEIGVIQAVAVTEAGPYQASVWVKPEPGSTCRGAFLQMRFQPSNQFVQVSLATERQTADAFTQIAVSGEAPEGTTRILIYLYSHAAETPRFVVDNVSLRKTATVQLLPTLANPSFEEPLTEAGVPTGWNLYGALTEFRALGLSDRAADGQQALILDDRDAAGELGVYQDLAAQGDTIYQVRVQVQALPEATGAGAYLQLRFYPSDTFRQVPLQALPGSYREITLTALAPPNTNAMRLYLYSHAAPRPRLLIDAVSLEIGDEANLPAPPPPPNVPVYEQLKDLHRVTPLVADGAPAITIVKPADGSHDAAANAVQAAIAAITGVTVPVVDDTAPAAAVPLTGHLICLGNRSTNATISALYDRYFTLLDLKHPGPGGHEVRTLHSPFGDGRNVIFCGGSDAAGVDTAAAVLGDLLRAAGGGPGQLRVGRLHTVKLSPDYVIPTDIREVKTWEDSDGYGSIGYFGWSTLAKRAALYYMTGDPFHAREFIRLAFPDAQAHREITEIDQERIENKDAPLSGPYHYNAHMMILFWDLIEESDVFTDEERLRVTNAFAQQFYHRQGEGIYGRVEVGQSVGSRHGQWSAISLYALARYFQAHYPHPLWQHCVEASERHFHPLHQSSWVAGESDNLYWFSTGIAPIFTYLTLTGDRQPIASGAVGELLRGQEILISGRVPDWALRSASLGYLHKAAYVTGDGRWIDYRQRTAMDTATFRLGQSYWPDHRVAPGNLSDLTGKWSVMTLAEPLWWSRNTGFLHDESFFVASYRNRTNADGDYILLDGFNGASRNPYHTFAILELRLAGHTVLRGAGLNQGYMNQVLTKADGMVEPQVAMDSALRHRSAVGEVVHAVGETPGAAFTNWRRTLSQRLGKYALVVDAVTFEKSSRNMEVETLWQTGNARLLPDQQAIRVLADGIESLPPDWTRVSAVDQTCVSEPAGDEHLVALRNINTMLLRATEPGQWLEMAWEQAEPFRGQVFVELLDHSDRGQVRLLLDGAEVATGINHHANGVQLRRVDLGQRDLDAGAHRLRVEVIGRHEGNDRCFVGLVGLALRPDGAGPLGSGAVSYAIRPCDPLPAVVRNDVTTVSWTGESVAGETRYDFSLIAPEALDGQPTACLRLAPNAAALRLPEPAVAFTGEWQGSVGDLVVVSATTIHGLGIRTLGIGGQPLLTADAPLTLDWDLTSGRLAVEAAAPTTLTWPGGNQQLAAGQHELRMPLPAPARNQLGQLLAGLLAEASTTRQAAVATAAAAGGLTAPALAAGWQARPSERAIKAIALAGSGVEQRIYAASDRTVSVLNSAGEVTGTISVEGLIRTICWWPEKELLLVGCADELVLAFDAAGQERWRFTSVMDEAVFRAAKQYWFKSAPGHEGIHGLATGQWLEGQESLCFVGSACTLEVLDGDGKLVQRTAVFWGPGNLFRLLPRADGSRDLLIGRWPNGTHPLSVLNSRNPSQVRRSFDGVPPGHTYVGGWASINRRRVVIDDLTGDGTTEVVSDLNGVWNRVTVWDEQGKPLAAAHFGPGPQGTGIMRDLTVCDLDGDGRKEIVTATNAGLVVALAPDCETIWSVRLPSPPAHLTAVVTPGGTRLVAACDNGQVVTIDGSGQVVGLAEVDGRPTWLEALGESGPVLVGTATGRLVTVQP